MNNFKTFVISLPEATDRQDIMRAHLGAHGVEFEFIEAVDGRQFDPATHPAHDTLKRRLFFGRDLLGAEIGCLLSHKKIYQKIVDEQIPLALIFEDDVELKDNFMSILEASLRHIDRYDILRFINKPKLIKKPHKKLIALDDTHHIIQTHGVPGGAYAYLITLDGAKKMLRQMEKNYLPIDTLMGQTWLTGMRARSLLISPGISDFRKDLGSFIGDDRFDKAAPDIKLPLALIYPLTRLGYKIYEAVMRQIAYR